MNESTEWYVVSCRGTSNYNYSQQQQKKKERKKKKATTIFQGGVRQKLLVLKASTTSCGRIARLLPFIFLFYVTYYERMFFLFFSLRFVFFILCVVVAVCETVRTSTAASDLSLFPPEAEYVPPAVLSLLWPS